MPHSWAVAKYPKTCRRCGVAFMAKHARALFCSSRCSDNHRYNTNPTEKNRIRAKRVLRYQAIGECALCGIRYSAIKTIKDLGGGMRNGAAVFMKDHIIPRAAGGSDDESNRRYLCWFCNMTRKDMDARHDEAIRQAAVAFWSVINGEPEEAR